MRYLSRLFFCMMLGLLMTFSSCVKDSDISQDNVIEPSSILVSNLVSSSYNASSFLDLNQLERALKTDTTFLELSNSELLSDQFSKTNLTFKLKNSLDKEFKIDVEFINDLNEVKFSLLIPVSSGTKEKPITVETKVAIEIPEITTFKEATKLVYKISMHPSDNKLSSDTVGMLELQSDATYFFDF